jgi:transposase
MIGSEMRGQIRRLVLVEGWRIETVARRFGVHHSVVRRALRDEPGSMSPRPPSRLDPFKPYIVERLTELPSLSAVRLHAELLGKGLRLGITPLRRYVALVRPPRPRRVYLRVEVQPGEQAQVDWGSFGHMRVGSTQRPLSVFAMVLSWSRAIFVDFSFDPQRETFLRMHRRALEFFAGVPRRIVYDNLQSVVLSRVGSTIQFNPRFLIFAGHYLFEPTAAPVRSPEFKGRVESTIKYIRQSFFYGRSFSSLEDRRAPLAAWRDQVANERIHATTRERPAERLLVERARLRGLPPLPFDADVVQPLIASKEARVRFDTNTYSVPPDCVGKTVTLRADDQRVRILGDGVEVAVHERSYDRRRHVEDCAPIERLLARRQSARGPKRRERLLTVCPETRLYLREVSRRRIHLGHETEKLLRLLDQYGEADFSHAVVQALALKTIGARYVRALCDQARFARGLGEPPEPIRTGNPLPTTSSPSLTTWRPTMPSSTTPTDPTMILTTVTAEAATTLSLGEVLCALGLHHAASLLDAATGQSHLP